MYNGLPAGLLDAIGRGACLPLVGWGFPDFVEVSPFEDRAAHADHHSSEIRRDRELSARRWVSNAGPRVWPLFEAVADLPVDCVIGLTPDPALPRILGART